jgi:hypothetical protein
MMLLVAPLNTLFGRTEPTGFTPQERRQFKKGEIMSANYIRKELIDSDAIVTSENSEVIQLDGCDVGTIQIVQGANAAAVDVPSDDISVDDNTFTYEDHGLVTGTVGQFTTSDTLPTGISALTNYYIIKIDADVFKVATSYALAVAGTAVNITGAGVGDQTFTPTAKSGSVQVQVTNVSDPASGDWVSKGAAVSLSGGAATSAVEYDRKELAYSKLRVAYTHTAGQFSLQIIANLKT